jgi:immunity protein 8 of polymorphic toxin system
MRAVVRHFISPDIDLDDFHPEDPVDFSFLLQVLVGPHDSEGEESLQLIVCTPRALERRVEAEGVVFGDCRVAGHLSDTEGGKGRGGTP